MKFKALTISVFALTLTFLSAAPAAAEWPWSRQQSVRQAKGGLPVAVPPQLAAIIEEAAAKYELDPKLLAAVAFKESRFKTDAVSSRGAQGIMQLMPRTARYVGVKDSFDARQNVFGGAKYLRMMFDTFNGDLEKSLAAYNAGPEAVKKKGVSATAEAVEYIATIKRYYGRG